MSRIRLDRELETVAADIRRAITGGPGNIDITGIQHSLLMLDNLVRLASVLEKELDVRRLNVDDAEIRKLLRDLARDAYAGRLQERGQVIRPEFGRRS